MLTEDQIQFLDKVCPDKWTETNGVISVEGDVNAKNMNLTEIPVQFGTIKGSIDCGSNKLTTLKGLPSIVHSFTCRLNQLTTLEGGPKEVDGDYSCSANILTSLIGAPIVCNVDFFCQKNQLTSLEGCPRLIKEDLNCRDNPNLHILYGIGRVNGNVYYHNINDINEWIIELARKDIFVTYTNIAEWIKQNNKLEFLLMAQPEIRQHFSPRILHLVDMGSYNESRILDYKKFSSLC